jgi:hypothetical protein
MGTQRDTGGDAEKASASYRLGEGPCPQKEHIYVQDWASDLPL